MDVRIEDLPPPTLVEDKRALDSLLDAMDGEEVVAVDTEADSFYSYRDKVCLFQVTAGDEDWLVDPLAGMDLSGLGDVLADPGVIKVFHDAEYDILILKKEFSFEFRNLFDTRVAAAVLGSEAPGLASVLRGRFGVELDKSQQRSNWAKRPLTPKQIAYARLDTRFLIPLMDEQQEELEKRDLAMIHETECRRLEILEPPAGGGHPDDYVRIKGSRTLDPKGASALRELHGMREKLAERLDLPPFRILGNKTIIELAQRRPQSDKELLRIDGITPKVLNRVGDRIDRALERAARNGPIQRMPNPPRKGGSIQLDEIESELHDRLKKLRRDAADELGIESAYLLNRHVLLELAKERPDRMDDLEDLDILEEWQLDRFGDLIVDTIDQFEDDVEKGLVPVKRRSRPRR